MSATLIVVDVQIDFCEGGSLPIQGGNRVANDIVNFLDEDADRYRRIVLSQDWHEPLPDTNGGHFALPPSEPDYIDSWPVHCVAGSDGAQLHPVIDDWVQRNLWRLNEQIAIVRKGQGYPAYSAFEGAVTWGRTGSLGAIVYDTKYIDVCGLAFDYCVRATALDAASYGQTTVLADLSASVSLDSVPKVVKEMREHGIELV